MQRNQHLQRELSLERQAGRVHPSQRYMQVGSEHGRHNRDDSSRSVGPPFQRGTPYMQGPLQQKQQQQQRDFYNPPHRSSIHHPAEHVTQGPEQKMVEISPDVWVRLRGADETWACIEQDYFCPVTCFGCTLELCCIQDADFVLCPVCRVVSPMNGLGVREDGGVGLGFTFDDLAKWQSEILAARQKGRSSPYSVYAA
jgi:hypothetical protein